MSELTSYYYYEDRVITPATHQYRVYHADKADKVIAELEERIADGDRDFEIVNHQNEKLLKIVCKHKYKRCLAMAMWCKTSALCDEGLGAFKYRDWYRKWYKRWLELAEKLKPNNQTARRV